MYLDSGKMVGVQYLAEFESPCPFSHPEGKKQCACLYWNIHTTKELEQLASRHGDGAPCVGAWLSSGFGHETKATSTDPLDTAWILDLTELERVMSKRIRPLDDWSRKCSQAGGVICIPNYDIRDSSNVKVVIILDCWSWQPFILVWTPPTPYQRPSKSHATPGHEWHDVDIRM